MKFEQAFYTREMGSGLGIYASSNAEYEFQNKCSRIGSKFETESGQDTAEFVYYSEDFNRYVGVGVSPYSYEKHEGRNKLVHIWVPEKASDDPSQYYLKYEFDRSFDRDSFYKSREFLPYLTRTDYPEILKKYDLSEKKLGELLEKVTPLVFREQNFLAMILPDEKYRREDFAEAARELTWLVSMLAPVPKEERSKYCKNLSYSVFSKENISVVNMAYVSQGKDYPNFFELGRKSDGKVSDLYMILAEKAMRSLEEYEDFIRELYTFRLSENDIDIENFQLMFFRLKLKKQDQNIKKTQIPVLWDTVIERAIKNLNYRKFLYHLTEKTKDLSEGDLVKLHKYILTKDIKDFDGNYSEDFFKAYTTAVVKAFETGNRLLFRAYLKIDETDDEETKEEIYTYLWNEKSVRSCVLKDIKRSGGGSELMELLDFYEPFRQKEEFLSQIKEMALGKEYYFQLEKEDREKISKALEVRDDKTKANEGQEPDGFWYEMLCAKIQNFFCMDKPYIAFLKKETGRVEDTLTAQYFSLYVKNCETDPGEEKRKQLQDAGRNYLKMYGEQVNAEDKEKFWKLDKIWSFTELLENKGTVSEENLTEVSVLLAQAEKIFSQDAAPVKVLKEKFEKNMDEAEQRLRELDKKIQSDERSKKEIEENLKKLNTWKKEIEQQIRTSEQDKQKMEDSIRDNRKSYQEKKECLEKIKNPILIQKQKDCKKSKTQQTEPMSQWAEAIAQRTELITQQIELTIQQTESTIQQTETIMPETENPYDSLKLTGDAEKY